MSDEKQQENEEVEALSEEELARQQAEELPDREAMTILPIDPTATNKILPVVE